MEWLGNDKNKKKASGEQKNRKGTQGNEIEVDKEKETTRFWNQQIKKTNESDSGRLKAAESDSCRKRTIVELPQPRAQYRPTHQLHFQQDENIRNGTEGFPKPHS